MKRVLFDVFFDVFFDIDTQLDFLYPAGALYVPGAERVVPAIAHLNRFAARHGMPVVSTTDAHFEDDVEFKTWPRHCVAGTIGQHKAESTLLERRVVIPNRACDLEGVLAGALASGGAQQIVVEKQTVDAFAAMNLGRILEHIQADRYVVYGVVTEICVLNAARGLLKTGKPVTVVTDAIEGLKAEDSRRALEEIRAAGGMLATVGQIAPG
jgi:nicotinamidase/pyrazinamidase